MTAVEIVALHVSAVHAYEGRPADGPRPDPDGGGRDRIEVRAGHGAVGDRYAGRAAHRTAAITVFAVEALEHVARVLDLAAVPDPLLVRRTIVLRGADVDALARTRDRPGAAFSLDSGDGPVHLQAHRAANPCAWMDVVLGPGAFRALRGLGGVRCEPLSDGVLRRGPAVLTVAPPPRPLMIVRSGLQVPPAEPGDRGRRSRRRRANTAGCARAAP